MTILLNLSLPLTIKDQKEGSTDLFSLKSNGNSIVSSQNVDTNIKLTFTLLFIEAYTLHVVAWTLGSFQSARVPIINVDSSLLVV